MSKTNQQTLVQTLSMATGASNTTLVYVGQFQNISLQVPAIVANFISGTVEFSYLVTPVSGVTQQTASIFDYVNLTPVMAKITCTTGGVYELPNAGSFPFIQIQANTTTTQATTLRLIYE